MSFREEEDGSKSSSSSRGLGFAAAAIGAGVGVGAALYYFFSKSPEHPDSSGSTSHWQQRQDALPQETSQNSRKNRAFRDRSRTLEECTICFDVILNNQESMSLPCTHNFHTACILPWLQQQQTCPVCRADAK